MDVPCTLSAATLKYLNILLHCLNLKSLCNNIVRAFQLEIITYPMDVPYTFSCHIEISEYFITLPELEIQKVQAII